MEDLNFEDLDQYLLKQHSKIIHQVWYDNILPNKQETHKEFEKLRNHRDSWLIKNPSWVYVCWNVKQGEELIKRCYPQHLEMYKNYPYPIQRCDVIRYFFLHRYGGLYADMDYHCNRSWDEVVRDFPDDIYLVETPNKISSEIHISNSLMYSRSNHVFWSTLFIELEIYKIAPMYYGRHMSVMFTTGPGILNRIFNKYKLRYKLGYYPFKNFHPFGLSTDVIRLQNTANIYAYHLGKGSWETRDSKILIFIYQEYGIILFIILGLVLPSLLFHLTKKHSKVE
jgi:mannosyltransferase OCH1-like enzyme